MITIRFGNCGKSKASFDVMANSIPDRSGNTGQPPVAIKMVEVGESTGSLQEMLGGVADFFDEEIETALGRVMTLLEPVLLVVMGIVIAGMLVALYMPLLQLGSLV